VLPFFVASAMLSDTDCKLTMITTFIGYVMLILGGVASYGAYRKMNGLAKAFTGVLGGFIILIAVLGAVSIAIVAVREHWAIGMGLLLLVLDSKIFGFAITGVCVAIFLHIVIVRPIVGAIERLERRLGRPHDPEDVEEEYDEEYDDLIDREMRLAEEERKQRNSVGAT
jgi:hypothetical protein